MSNSNVTKQEIRLMTYQIRLKGQLKHDWIDWFEGQSITNDTSGNTLLTCQVPDQVALFGRLRKIRDLGLPLISVKHLYFHKDEVAKGEKL